VETAASEGQEVTTIPETTEPTNGKRYATREELLSYSPRATKDVYWEPLQMWFQLTELSVTRQDRIRDSVMRPAKTRGGDPEVDISGFRRKLVIECLIQPKLTPEDFTALGEIGGQLFNALQDAAAKLNGVDEDSQKEAERDSPTTQS